MKLYIYCSIAPNWLVYLVTANKHIFEFLSIGIMDDFLIELEQFLWIFFIDFTELFGFSRWWIADDYDHVVNLAWNTKIKFI